MSKRDISGKMNWTPKQFQQQVIDQLSYCSDVSKVWSKNKSTRDCSWFDLTLIYDHINAKIVDLIKQEEIRHVKTIPLDNEYSTPINFMMDTRDPSEHIKQFLQLNAIHIFSIPSQNNAEIAIATLSKMNDPYIERFAIIPNMYRRSIYNFWKKDQREKNVIQKPILPEEVYENIMDSTVRIYKERENFLAKSGRYLQVGLLFHGLPGNGKTYTIKYLRRLAKKYGIPFRSVSGSELQREMHSESLADDSGLIVFDDIDVSVLTRSDPGANPTATCELLGILDGIERKTHQIRIFTTNEKVNNIDSALLRPGRIDSAIYFEPPTKDLILEFLEKNPECLREDMPANEDTAQKLLNYTFAEIAKISDIMIQNEILYNQKISLDTAIEKFEQTRNGKQDLNVINNRKMGFAPQGNERDERSSK